ncbi:MAG: glutamate-1-semialdehyde 2,1-aminomutase [Roseburia sp.]
MWQDTSRRRTDVDDKSQELFARAKKHIPGGVNSPVRAFGGVGRTPRFINSAKGDRITDVDGNEMIDYVCSWGPGILGHAHPQVIEAVKEACDQGLSFGAPTAREVELAELIAELVPSMEVSRLVSSGTEAVMSAIRAARGYTGRDKIIKFKGCYHGHSDGLLVKAGSAALTTSVPDSAGVPADYTKNTLVALYNDPASVEQLFAENPGEIAAVIVEPVAANMGVVLPGDGFLQFLRDITTKNGALLIFDEVITGFRLALGGAQQYFGIRPDLTTLGKIVGGGMPIGAYGGSREIMQCISPDGPVYQAGTLSGNPVATAAGLKTLQILQAHPEIYPELARKTNTLAEAVREAARGRVTVNQIGSLMSIFFTEDPVVDYESAVHSDTGRYADYFGYLLDRGIYVAPAQFEAMFVSAAHTEEDIEKTCQVFRSYFAGMYITEGGI